MPQRHWAGVQYVLQRALVPAEAVDRPLFVHAESVSETAVSMIRCWRSQLDGSKVEVSDMKPSRNLYEPLDYSCRDDIVSGHSIDLIDRRKQTLAGIAYNDLALDSFLERWNYWTNRWSTF